MSWIVAKSISARYMKRRSVMASRTSICASAARCLCIDTSPTMSISHNNEGENDCIRMTTRNLQNLRYKTNPARQPSGG